MAMATVNPSIIYEQQTLTQEQKDQVLSNIGAMKAFDGVPFTSADRNKLDGIDSGAEVNTIETVKVNGTALTPDANKAVDITVPEVDTTYNASSLNPQSGTAVAAAIAASGNVPTPQTTDDGKVLKAYEDTSTSTMAYKWDVADSGIPSKTSGDNGKVLGVTNDGQSLEWISQPTVNNSTVSVKIGSASETAIGTMTTNQSAASDIVVPMASATDDGSGNWTYVNGAMAGTDKKALDAAVTKLGGIEAGAQVNVKPDWEAASGADAEILNKPNIPTVNDSTISVKIEGDSDAFDSFTTNASSNDTVEIPLATAPAGASAGNSGAITAADKAKLNSLTGTHLHMLKVVSDTVEDPAPYGYWIVDMEKPNASANYGYDYALASELIDGINAGNIYGLYINDNAPTIGRNQDDDIFVMSRAKNQENTEGAKDDIRMWFYKLFSADDPLSLRVTTIYTPSSNGRMAFMPYNAATASAAQNEYQLSTRGVPSADSSDAGKFLGVDSNGDYDWETVEHVPDITSSDNGKVLTASYSGGVGTAAWAAPSANRKVHRLFYYTGSAHAGDDYGYLLDLESEYDQTTGYAKVLAADLNQWISDGQLIVLIVSTQDNYVYGSYCYCNYNYNNGTLEFIESTGGDLSYYTIRSVDVSGTTYTMIILDDYAKPYRERYPAIPTITSGDDGKVLTASYDSVTDEGSFSWETVTPGHTYSEGTGISISNLDAISVKIDGSTITTNASGQLTATGESNTINTVKVNGTALTPDANKAVDVSVPAVKLEGAASSLTPSSNVVTIPNAIATGETGASNGLMTADDKKTVSESVIYKANPTSGASALLAQRLYVVRSDQEIINIISGGGAEGQGTILFRIG